MYSSAMISFRPRSLFVSYNVYSRYINWNIIGGNNIRMTLCLDRTPNLWEESISRPFS